MHGLSEGYEIKAASLDDLDAVAAVMQAADGDLTGGSDLDADMIRDQWSSPAIDLTLDAWVVSNGDEVVG